MSQPNLAQYADTHPGVRRPVADVHVSLVGRSNLTEQIYRQLKETIERGGLRPGDTLPSSRELGRRLDVSRNTVVNAYLRLAADGLVKGRAGSGYQVLSRPRRLRAVRPGTGGALQPQPVWERVYSPPNLAADKPEFDFRPGIPDVSGFPFATWRALLNDEFRASAVGRGVYGEPLGRPELREAIARHVMVSRQVITEPEEVVVTNGAQQALDLILRVLAAPGDTVVVEDPGYRPVRHLLHSHGLRAHPVPVDEEGLVVDLLPTDAKLVYVTPTHQFPLGMTMSLERRHQLLEWASRTGAAIIEDDYDSEFRFAGRPLEPLQAIDEERRVVYVGSFSKAMLPTLRLGFVVAPPQLLDAFRKAKFLSDWQTSENIQGALAAFIDRGCLAQHLRRMRRRYADRHRRIEAHLRGDLGHWLEPIPAQGGIHLAARLRNVVVPDERVARAAARAGIGLQPSSYYAARPLRPGHLVLGYGGIPEDRIRTGMSRLRDVLRRCC
jgi:GntR family transcriptional regulator/MocR family aminotransferase